MIADSSVLIIFARAQRLDLLHRTVGVVGLTSAVKAEAVDGAPERPDAAGLRRALERRHLVVVAVPRGPIEAIARRYPNLGRGEASSIAAALHWHEPALLMDERAARRAASMEGLTPVGTLGVLAKARRKAVLKTRDEVAAALRDVLGAGLWVAPEVVEAFWAGLGGAR